MSLRLRLTLLTGLLIGATTLLFAVTFYIVLHDNLYAELDSRLQERAGLVTHMLEESGDAATLSAYIPPLVEFDSPGIYVELLTLDGTVQVSSPNLAGGRLPTVSKLDAVARTGRMEIASITAGGDEQLRLLIIPAQRNSVLVVAESLEPLQRTLAQARDLLLICGMLALIVALVGAALLTGRALAPINRLTRVAATIAVTGHYHKRVPFLKRADEIGQLATTINDLIATVERTLNQQRQFLADTSHELRSPLTVVLANLNLLRKDLNQDERDQSVREATAEAQRMRRLVNDLLLLARADAAQAIVRAPVQLEQVVEETVAIIARQMPGYSVLVHVDAPVVITGDQERLTQLLRNLLENAIYHTPLRTIVEVRLCQSHQVVQLSVADNGPGIAAEHLPHIWERFYRVDKARSHARGGTGLGLAIVKYIAEAHGGSVNVVSELGQGTTFTVLLPLAAVSLQTNQTMLATSAWLG